MTWTVRKGDLQPAPMPPVEAHEPVTLAGFYDAPPLTWSQRCYLFCMNVPLNQLMSRDGMTFTAIAYCFHRMAREGVPVPDAVRAWRAPISPVRQRRAARTS